MVRNTIRFYGEELLAPRPSPKQEDQPLSALRDCIFNIFAATLHIGGRSSIRNLRPRNAVVTAPHTGNNNQLIDLVINIVKTRCRCKFRPVSVYMSSFLEILRNPFPTLLHTGFITTVMLNCTNILCLICLLTISGEGTTETDSLTYEAGLLTTQHDFQSCKWNNNEVNT
jgi:hypothetical protein